MSALLHDTLWPELTRLALLGTDRTEPDEAVRAALAELGVDPELPAAEQLLEGAALLYLLNRARPALPLEPEDAQQAVAPPEVRPACPVRSAYHLELILGGEYRAVLPEYLRLLAAAGCVPPPAALPALLRTAGSDPSLRPLILANLSERGRWLAERHPDWQLLLPPADPAAAWPTATEAGRPALLVAWRGVDPKAARLALEALWPGLDPPRRAALLPALHTGLSYADEPFLEVCLDERRREVRLAAADLLARLPDSRLQQRLWEHARPVLRAQGQALQLRLPENLPDETRRDGILPTANKTTGGIKLSWLTQLLGRIPPRRWLDETGLPPHQFVGAFANVPYGETLQRALAEATLLHDDEEVATALIYFWQDRSANPWWDHPPAFALLRRAPAEVFEKVVIRHLEQSKSLAEAGTLATRWLLLGSHPWSRRLTLLLVGGFQDELSRPTRRAWQVAHYESLLKVAGIQGDPGTLDVLRTGWWTKAPGLANWAGSLERLLQTLSFRAEMRRGVRSEE